jgi:hypothetical protein
MATSVPAFGLAGVKRARSSSLVMGDIADTINPEALQQIHLQDSLTPLSMPLALTETLKGADPTLRPHRCSTYPLANSMPLLADKAKLASIPPITSLSMANKWHQGSWQTSTALRDHC